jgi:hypothetical protein
MAAAKDPIIDHAELLQRLHYDPLTGLFTWLDPIKGRVVPGDRAGTTKGGYVTIRFRRRIITAHRLAWFYVHGVFPAKLLDHINCDGRDNRLANLREATASGNGANRKVSRNNTSGLKGVHWAADCGRWCAQIRVHGKRRNLGYFSTKAEAGAAYQRAAMEAFGEFARAA